MMFDHTLSSSTHSHFKSMAHTHTHTQTHGCDWQLSYSLLHQLRNNRAVRSNQHFPYSTPPTFTHTRQHRARERNDGSVIISGLGMGIAMATKPLLTKPSVIRLNRFLSTLCKVFSFTGFVSFCFVCFCLHFFRASLFWTKNVPRQIRIV